ncbi:MAG: flagellar basal body L-ring protein FlgH [candidate division Zixibacteria bacterium]|nr:flagellar basal body L-ring protein FlgH [candidate division Zixibacteria bacterium]MDD5426155.1 flagellar basal body L-ring protein FlgH [candidate division Zixibacteria bacterium]
MNLKKIAILLLILLLLPFALKLKSQDFGRGQSLFTDVKAHQVGDILTVLIYEDSRASNQVESKNSKDQKTSVSGGPGAGPLDFIPLFGVDAAAKYTHDGKGEQLRNGMIRAKMSVTVMGVKENGDLIIEGSRVIGISNDKESITLSGVIRPKDISTDNTIESYLIADAEIHYTGKGNSQTSSRPGIVARLINWLF